MKVRAISKSDQFDRSVTFEKRGGDSIYEKIVGSNITIVLTGAFPRLHADVEKGGGWMQKSDTFMIEFTEVE